MKKSTHKKRKALSVLAFLFFLTGLMSYFGGITSVVSTKERIEMLGDGVENLEGVLSEEELSLYHQKKELLAQKSALVRVPISYLDTGERETVLAQRNVNSNPKL